MVIRRKLVGNQTFIFCQNCRSYPKLLVNTENNATVVDTILTFMFRQFQVASNNWKKEMYALFQLLINLAVIPIIPACYRKIINQFSVHSNFVKHIRLTRNTQFESDLVYKGRQLLQYDLYLDYSLCKIAYLKSISVCPEFVDEVIVLLFMWEMFREFEYDEQRITIFNYFIRAFICTPKTTGKTLLKVKKTQRYFVSCFQ